mgnify:FL=1
MSRNLTPEFGSGIILHPKLSSANTGRPLLMGILNLTPDSFYQGSRLTKDGAIKQAENMIQSGADWIDIGGESTRPGATTISIEEELERVIPVINSLRKKYPNLLISVDTRNHEVARQAITSGANMINDVSGLRDQKMFDLVVDSKCAVCIMHMLGEPGNMQKQPKYHNVVEEVITYLEKKAEQLIERGHPRDLIAIDPGIGFGKTQEHNLALMKAVKRFKASGFAVLWGISRKSIIGHITGKSNPEDRLPGTLASSIYGAINGVDILRVHDIDEHNDLLGVFEKLTD